MAWTKEDIETVRVGWERGDSATEIAITLLETGKSASRNAVIGIIHRHNFKRNIKAVAAAPRRERASVGTTTVSPPRRRQVTVVPPKRTPPEPEPEVQPLPEPRPLPPEGGVALVDLEHWHCRMVVSEHPYVFCGAPKAFGTSWCAACAPVVFTKDGFERLAAGRKPPQRVSAAA
jgi:hypothetical protein